VDRISDMVTGGRVAMSIMMLGNCKVGYVVLGSQVAGAARVKVIRGTKW
jgi:hypothetical protein